MDITEQTSIAYLLKEKGFQLQESSPKHLRFERQNEDGDCEVNILISRNSLPVTIKRNDTSVSHNSANFAELKDYLEQEFNNL